MARTLVAVNAQGRVTLPADVRRKLRLTEGSRLEVALEDDRITLRPAQVVAAEDAWAYTAETLTGIREALEDVRAGRVYQGLTEADLLSGRPQGRSRTAARARSVRRAPGMRRAR